MKKIFLLLVLVLIYSCLDELYKYQLDNDDIKVNCYYYSDITNSSMDFIEVVKNDSVVLIAKVFPGISNLQIVNDSILIDIPDNENLVDGEIRRTEKVFNYKIVYRKVDSYQEYLRRKRAQESSEN